MSDLLGQEIKPAAKAKVVLTHPDGREIVLEHFFIVGFTKADVTLEEDTNVEVVTTVNLDAMIFCEGIAVDIVDKYRAQQEEKETGIVSGPAAIVQFDDLKRKQ
jgi:hypothetical protein